MIKIKDLLSRSPLHVLAIYSSIVIFLLYTCCYAYRKPFTVGLYEGQSLWGIDYKILFVLFEIVGYALSKFIGTHVLPSMKKSHRIFYVVGLLTFSEFSWLGFALLPDCLKFICVFFSGLPLGMIWGIIFSFIEGRRISEVLNVGLSVALIVSSGLVKSLGSYVLAVFPVSEYWMPFITGVLVYPLMLLCAFLLNQIPEPDRKDIQMRTERPAMNRVEKRVFIRRFLWGICLLVLMYASLTVFRELRDSFAADIWYELQVNDTMIFTKTEYPIAFVVLAMMFSLVFVKDNRLALNIIYLISVLGACITILSTLAYAQGYLDPLWWMILSGLGMYMGYIPFTYLIERLIASMRIACTAVFLIYLADSFGYLGTAAVFLVKNFVAIDISWTTMLVYTAVSTSLIAVGSIFGTYIYFKRQLNSTNITFIAND